MIFRHHDVVLFGSIKALGIVVGKQLGGELPVDIHFHDHVWITHWVSARDLIPVENVPDLALARIAYRRLTE